MAYIDSLFFSLSIPLKIVVIAILMAFIVVFAVKKRQLTTGGVAAAVMVGSIITYIAGLSGLLIMLF